MSGHSSLAVLRPSKLSSSSPNHPALALPTTFHCFNRSLGLFLHLSWYWEDGKVVVTPSLASALGAGCSEPALEDCLSKCYQRHDLQHSIKLQLKCRSDNV